MSEKAAIRFSTAIFAVGLGYLALEYSSMLAGIGAVIATISAFDFD
jgi:hypothetical protein